MQYSFKWEVHSSATPWAFVDNNEGEANETFSVSEDYSQSSKKPSKSETLDKGCTCEDCECTKDQCECSCVRSSS
jgi:hypothetical protein